ncbi:MAG: hypothetical protein B7Z79_00175 [Thiomonas sp. 20-64-9]|nr:MAG: hypothetical protein B7Z79_00175 [Thiomonas sp. 20-64-9]
MCFYMHMSKAAQFFKLFADPTRYRILHLLTLDECCVCELVDAVQTQQYTVSRHLAGLRKGGWVVERRDGTWIYYRLAPEHAGLIKSVLQTVQAHGLDLPLLTEDAARLQTRLELRTEGRCTLGYGIA